MQCICRPLRYQQFHQLNTGFVKCYQGPVVSAKRLYASQSSPGIGFSSAPTKDSKPQKSRSGVSGRSQAKKGEENPEEETSKTATLTDFLKRSPLSLRQVILLGALAAASYGIYTFQTDPKRSVILQPRFFTPFILDSRERISSTSSILHLRSVPSGQNTANVIEAWRTGVWSLQVMQPELQIARSYTPLPPLDGAEPEQIRLFVRKEPHGEVSSFLHRINRGTLVHLRGPQVEYELPENVDEVLFIAGGTGIAPALQVAYTLFSHRASSPGNATKLRILWANRRREDSFLSYESAKSSQPQAGLLSRIRRFTTSEETDLINQANTEKEEGAPPAVLGPQTILVDELEALKSKHPGKVEIEYFIDEDKSYISESVLQHYLGGHNKHVGDASGNESKKRKLLLISGPEGFVNFYAGPKPLKAGRETQGPLGGLLQKIGPRDWDVWKL